MRAVAAVVAIVILVSAIPATQAHPFPQTRHALRELAHDSLADVDASGAKLLHIAKRLVRMADEAAGAIPIPSLPQGPDTTQGALEVRAALVQPGIRGQDELLATLWLGASEGHWTGAYWVESDTGGSTFPNLGDIDETGVLLFLDGGGLATSDTIHVTYHFLGVDGAYVRYALDEIPLLPAIPILDRVDIGGLHGSSRGKDPEAILITPWNLLDHNVTMGLTLLAGDVALDDITVGGCADAESSETEPGCRILYVLPFPAALSSIEVWRIGSDGERVVDRELSRIDVLSGAMYAG